MRIVQVKNLSNSGQGRYSLTIKQASEYTGLGEGKLRELIDSGNLRVSKPGKQILIYRAELEEFIDRYDLKVPKVA